MKEYDHDTPVKILYEERKKRKSKDVRENIILSAGIIETNTIVYKNKLRYNNKFDVLSVHSKDVSNSYGNEETDNIVLFRDFDTNNFTGVTILSFLEMYYNHDKRLDLVKKYFDIKRAVEYCEQLKRKA